MDVFQVVKSLRVQKPEAVPTLVRIRTLLTKCKYDLFYRRTSRQYLIPSLIFWIHLTLMLTFKMCNDKTAALSRSRSLVLLRSSAEEIIANTCSICTIIANQSD